MPDDLYEDDDIQKDAIDGDPTPDADDDPDMLPGAAALHQSHDYLAAGHDLHDDLRGGQENERVRELLQEIQDTIRDKCQAIQDAFAEEYPDHEPPPALEAEAEEPEELEEKTEEKPVPEPDEDTEKSRKSDEDEDEEKKSRKTRKSLRRRIPATSGVSRKSLSSDALDRAIERKRARLLALELEDLD